MSFRAEESEIFFSAHSLVVGLYVNCNLLQGEGFLMRDALINEHSPESLEVVLSAL